MRGVHAGRRRRCGRSCNRLPRSEGCWCGWTVQGSSITETTRFCRQVFKGWQHNCRRPASGAASGGRCCGVQQAPAPTCRHVACHTAVRGEIPRGRQRDRRRGAVDDSGQAKQRNAWAGCMRPRCRRRFRLRPDSAPVPNILALKCRWCFTSADLSQSRISRSTARGVARGTRSADSATAGRRRFCRLARQLEQQHCGGGAGLIGSHFRRHLSCSFPCFPPCPCHSPQAPLCRQAQQGRQVGSASPAAPARRCLVRGRLGAAGCWGPGTGGGQGQRCMDVLQLVMQCNYILSAHLKCEQGKSGACSGGAWRKGPPAGSARSAADLERLNLLQQGLGLGVVLKVVAHLHRGRVRRAGESEPNARRNAMQHSQAGWKGPGLATQTPRPRPPSLAAGWR